MVFLNNLFCPFLISVQFFFQSLSVMSLQRFNRQIKRGIKVGIKYSVFCQSVPKCVTFRIGSIVFPALWHELSTVKQIWYEKFGKKVQQRAVKKITAKKVANSAVQTAPPYANQNYFFLPKQGKKTVIEYRGLCSDRKEVLIIFWSKEVLKRGSDQIEVYALRKRFWSFSII